MVKRIDKFQSIVTEKVLGTEIIPCNDLKHYVVLFGFEIEQKEQLDNMKIVGLGSFKGIIAHIKFNTIEEAQDYINTIMITHLDYNDYDIKKGE